MADERIVGAAPPKKMQVMEVVRVKTTDGRDFTVLSEVVFGQLIHYNGNRSSECTADHKKCFGCGQGWPQDWKGYLHCQDWTQEMAEVFLELTWPACQKLFKQIPERRTLRGTLVKVKKTKGGAKGRYIIEVKERVIPHDVLPQSKDPLETLRFLWRARTSGDNRLPS